MHLDLPNGRDPDTDPPPAASRDVFTGSWTGTGQPVWEVLVPSDVLTHGTRMPVPTVSLSEGKWMFQSQFQKGLVGVGGRTERKILEAAIIKEVSHS